MPGPCSSPPRSSALPRAQRTGRPHRRARPRTPAPRHPSRRRPRPTRARRPRRAPTTDPSATTSPTPTSPAPSPSATATATSPAASPSPSASSSAVARRTGGRRGRPPRPAFIARTLADGGDHYVYPGGTFFDGGNTIDAILALTRSAPSRPSPTPPWPTSRQLGDYVGSLRRGVRRPGRQGAARRRRHRRRPDAFGGHDLVAELQALETTKGRFSDDSAYGDYSNTIGQSLAAHRPLPRRRGAQRRRRCSYLLDQQCADGGFRGARSTAGGACDERRRRHRLRRPGPARREPTPSLCGSADETLPADVAAAAQQGSTGSRTSRAVGWLRQRRRRLNANTTGVAAQAFPAGGRTAAADAAIGLPHRPSSTTPPARRPCAAASPSRRTPAPRPSRATPTCGPPRRPPSASRAAPSSTPSHLVSRAPRRAHRVPARGDPCSRSSSPPRRPTPSSSVDPTSTGRADRGRRRVRPVDHRRRVDHRLARPDRHRPAAAGPARPGCSSSSAAWPCVASTRRRGAHA